MRLHTTDLLTEGLNDALSAAGLPAVGDMFWEVPRDERHGDYATNVAMTLAREAARQPPRKIAEAIVAHFPQIAGRRAPRDRGPRLRQRLPRARAGARARSATILAAGADVRAVPTRARASAISSSSSRPIRPARSSSSTRARPRWATRSRGSSGARATGRDASTTSTTRATSSMALARSFEVRLRQALGEAAELPENAYPGEYLIDLAADCLGPGSAGRARPRSRGRSRSGSSGSGACAVDAHGGGPAARARRLRHARSTAGPTSSATCATAGLPERAHRGADRGGPHLRAGRRALVPLHRVRRRQGPRAAQVGRRADLLRGRHRLPPLRKFARRRPRHQLPRAGPPRLRGAHARRDAGARPPARGASTC